MFNMNMLNILKMAKNPMDMLKIASQSNPQIAQIMKEVDANGGDAKALFYKKASEIGIDADKILSQLRN